MTTEKIILDASTSWMETTKVLKKINEKLDWDQPLSRLFKDKIDKINCNKEENDSNASDIACINEMCHGC